tara:strand:- start:979 stop:3432 length:2454 start_codon:yes stop_codon:yes gene_type:complete
MTVSATTTRNDYVATNGQTVFAYTFKVLVSTDMVVVKNGVTQSGYSISGLGVATGGNVTLSGGAATGDTVSVYLAMPVTRDTNYQEGGAFLADEVNADFDKIYIGAIQNENAVSRSVRLQDSDAFPVSMDLPLRDDRKGKYVYFNASTGALEAVAGTSATGDSGVVSYQATQTGSVKRTVQEKLNESVSVLDFGATGDGSTDDTVAIQTALNTGKSVYLPIGNYKTSATIFLAAKGQRFYGESRDDSQIVRTNTTSPVLELKYSRITIDNFTVRHDSLPDKSAIETARASSNVGQGALLYWPETDGVTNGGKGWHTIRNMGLRMGYTAIENDWNATESGIFSASIENIYCRQINGSFVLLNPGGSANSGCVWNNCYFANSRGDGILMNRAFDYREGANSSFNQLNIEACNVVANEVMYLQNIRGAVFDSIHVEDVTIAPLSATAGSFLNATTSSSLTISGLHLNKLGVNGGTGTGQASHFTVFKVGGNGTQQPSFVATETSVRAVAADSDGVNDNTNFVNGLNPTNFYLVNMTDSDLELSEGVSVAVNGFRSEKNITKPVYSSDTDLENYGINRLEFAFFNGSSSATKIENYTTLNNIGNFLRFVEQPNVVISSGAVTVAGANAVIDTEGSASTDDLVTINGGASGDILVCTANNGSRVVVLKDGSGNLKLDGDFSLSTVNDKIVLLKNSSGNWCELSRSANPNPTFNDVQANSLNFGDSPTDVVIASGVITASASFLSVDTEGSASTDDLVTINGGRAGQMLILRAANNSRTVVVKDNTGNLKLTADFSLDNGNDALVLIYSGSNWLEVSRADNAS